MGVYTRQGIPFAPTKQARIRGTAMLLFFRKAPRQLATASQQQVFLPEARAYKKRIF
jgi:hypothetical protein